MKLEHFQKQGGGKEQILQAKVVEGNHADEDERQGENLDGSG